MLISFKDLVSRGCSEFEEDYSCSIYQKLCLRLASRLVDKPWARSSKSFSWLGHQDCVYCQRPTIFDPNHCWQAFVELVLKCLFHALIVNCVLNVGGQLRKLTVRITSKRAGNIHSLFPCFVTPDALFIRLLFAVCKFLSNLNKVGEIFYFT